MGDLDNFDANEHDPLDDFSPMPEGEYTAAITASEWKQTKAGTGSYLQFEFEILQGKFSGRKVWTRLNLKNKNETAVHIAKRELSGICHAVRVLTPKDSSELHGKPMTIKVVLKERGDKPGQFSNEIKKYSVYKSVDTSNRVANSEAPPWRK